VEYWRDGKRAQRLHHTITLPLQSRSTPETRFVPGAAAARAAIEREREVLVMLAQGIPNKEIADKLHLAEGTVKNHVSNILGKLQAQNRTEAADIARRRGLI
jgi:DNA-binding NarL/FixJ family response regulator